MWRAVFPISLKWLSGGPAQNGQLEVKWKGKDSGATEELDNSNKMDRLQDAQQQVALAANEIRARACRLPPSILSATST